MKNGDNGKSRVKIGDIVKNRVNNGDKGKIKVKNGDRGKIYFNATIFVSTAGVTDFCKALLPWTSGDVNLYLLF